MFDEHRFIRLRPRLYHFSTSSDPLSIGRNGLLCARDLLHLLPLAERSQLAERRRFESVSIVTEGKLKAVIRDQKPLFRNLGRAVRCLHHGQSRDCHTSPDEWVDVLNERVYFSTQLKDTQSLMKAYRGRGGTLISFSSQDIFDRYRDRIRLATINTGFTEMWPALRCRCTFQSLADYPKAAVSRVKELTVTGSMLELPEFFTEFIEPGKHSAQG